MSLTQPDYWQGLIRMGLTKLFMLRALREEPQHGYDLARRTADLSNGVCTPTWAAIYPTLREWERQGLVYSYEESVRRRRRTVYALTETGREAFEVACREWEAAARTVLETRILVPERLENHLL